MSFGIFEYPKPAIEDNAYITLVVQGLEPSSSPAASNAHWTVFIQLDPNK